MKKIKYLMLQENYLSNKEKNISKKVFQVSKKFDHASIGNFVDHIDYIVSLIGIDHVGISSYFGGGGGIEGWRDASTSYRITMELLKRGYSEQQIKKLWGENLIRVWEQVLAYANGTKI